MKMCCLTRTPFYFKLDPKEDDDIRREEKRRRVNSESITCCLDIIVLYILDHRGASQGIHNAFSKVATTPEKTCCFLYFVHLKGFSVICKSLITYKIFQTYLWWSRLYFQMNNRQNDKCLKAAWKVFSGGVSFHTGNKAYVDLASVHC